MIKVIALSGWKGSGKDTVASILIGSHGYKRYAFADVLKDMVADEFNIPRNYCDDVSVKESPLSQYEVNPQDAFSRMIASSGLLREFAYADGSKPAASASLEGAMEKGKLYWTPRALCILKGSVARSVNSNYWVGRVIRKIYEDGSLRAVISDLRYKSEIKALREYYTDDEIKFVRVSRFDKSDSTDPSERDLDDYPFQHIIENRQSIAELKNAVNNLNLFRWK